MLVEPGNHQCMKLRKRAQGTRTLTKHMQFCVYVVYALSVSQIKDSSAGFKYEAPFHVPLAFLVRCVPCDQACGRAP
jgi:hypothetical protein